MVLGRIKSPFISNPCMFQSVPNKEDQRRVKLHCSEKVPWQKLYWWKGDGKVYGWAEWSF